MSQTLELVPGGSQSTSVTAPTSHSTSTSHSLHPGSHDAIRYGPSIPLSAQHAADAKHPAQDRLERWDQTRDELKLNMSRNVYGVGAPVRTLMERKIVAQSPHFPSFTRSSIPGSTHSGLSSLHLSILNGTDETLDPTDFLPSEASLGSRAYAGMLDEHSVMERKWGI